MNCNPNVEKLVQITEELQKPVHVPIVFGNDCFIVTQQDMRKIENIRLLTYSKLAPNGDLIPAEYLGHEAHIREAILNACKYSIQVDQNAGISDIKILANLINMMCTPQGMEMGMTAAQVTPAVATLQQQMQWENVNNSAPFPFSHTTATSTDDASTCNSQNKSNCCGCCCSSSKNTRSYSRGSNTMDADDSSPVCDGPLSAREQLKKKKLSQGLCLCIS